jgi:hypothetical protein
MPVIALHAMMVHVCDLIESSRRPYPPVIIRMTTRQRVFVVYLPDLIIRHRTGYVAFVLEDEETRAHQTLEAC